MAEVTAKVAVRFRDKNTKEIHEVGTEYKGTDERINELKALGFVEVEGNDGDLFDDNFDKTEDLGTLSNGTKKETLRDLTIAQLQDVAKECDIEIPGDITKKDDIVKFLTDAE